MPGPIEAIINAIRTANNPRQVGGSDTGTKDAAEQFKAAIANAKIEEDHKNGKSYHDIYVDAFDSSKTGIVTQLVTHPNQYGNLDINATDRVGQNAASHALFNSDRSLIRTLVNAGVDISHLDESGASGYQYAKPYADGELPGGRKISPNADIKANVDYVHDALNSQLQKSVHDGDETRSIALIKAGADPKGEVSPNISLLSYAASNTNSDTVKALLDAIPDGERKDFINKQGAGGRTALHSAADAGDQTAYNYLKNAGGDEGIKSEAGKTPKDLLDPGINNKQNRSNQTLDSIRKNNNVGSANDLNFLQQQAKDGKGSIQDEALTNLYNKYKGLVDKHKLSDDSVEAKFVRTIQAQASLQSGYTIIPYDENQFLFGATRQDFGKPTELTSQDVGALIDGDKLKNQLSDLFQDQKISGDYRDSIKLLAKDKGVDLNKTADDLYNQITDPGYTTFLQQAGDQKLGDQAKAQVRNDIGALTSLDPDKGAKAAQILQQNSLTADINKYVTDPSEIPDKSKIGDGASAFFDAIRPAGTAAGVNVPRTVIGALNEFYDLKGKVGTDQWNGFWSKLSESSPNGNVTTQGIQDAVNSQSVPDNVKPELINKAQELNRRGILGTIVGVSSLVGAVGNAAGKNELNGKIDPIAFTQSILSFASFSPAYLKLGANIIKGPQSKNIIDALGLSKTLPEIWGKSGSISSQINSQAGETTAEPGEANPQPGGESGSGSSSAPSENNPGSASNGSGTPENPRPPSPGPGLHGAGENIELTEFYQAIGSFESSNIDNLDLTDPRTGQPFRPSGSTEGGATTTSDNPTDGSSTTTGTDGASSDVKVPPSTAAKITATVGKALGAVGDLGGGIFGIVSGALSLKSADTPEAKAAGALTIGSGAATAFAGGIEAAGLFSSAVAGAAGAGIAVAGGFVVGGVLALGGFIASIVADLKAHNKTRDAAKEQDKFFRALAKDGVLKEGWQDKLEYARYETYEYKGRDAPKDQSLYDFQSVEFNYFAKTPGKDGSSNNRLNPSLHKHFDSSDKNDVPGEAGS